MKIFYLTKFVRQYKKLSPAIKKSAEEKEKLFRNDPFSQKLKTHKLHGELSGFFAFSINNRIRIIFDFDDNGDVRFYTIGNHDIYY